MEVKGGIYGLIDPLSGELRYVGQSVCLSTRKKNHCRHRPTGNTYCDNWKKSLWAKGLRPEFLVIEYIDGIDKLNEAEEFYIEYFTFIGCNLTNHLSGGENKIPDKTTRNKLSSYAKNRTEEHRAKLGAAISESISGENHPLYGTSRSTSTKEKISNSNKGKVPWNKGKTGIYSKDTLNKMSKAAMSRRGKKKFCKHGHRLSEENLYIRKNGNRECRSCMKERKKNKIALNPPVK